MLLGNGALVLGAAAAMSATNAVAQSKVSQTDAKYQDHPNAAQRCDGCLQFQAPNACKIV